MTFQIESGVPLPKAQRGPGRKATEFPIGDMQVGDSFLMPCDVKNAKELANWRRKFLLAKKRFLSTYEGAFKTLTVDGGIRVWRTA